MGQDVTGLYINATKASIALDAEMFLGIGGHVYFSGAIFRASSVITSELCRDLVHWVEGLT